MTGDTFHRTNNKEGKQKRIPIALPHLSIKLNGTWYRSKPVLLNPFLSSWPLEGSLDSLETMFAFSKPYSAVLGLAVILNSRKCSTGTQDSSSLSQLSCGLKHSSVTGSPLCTNNGLGHHTRLSLKHGHQKDEGFLFACKSADTSYMPEVIEHKRSMWINTKANIHTKWTYIGCQSYHK